MSGENGEVNLYFSRNSSVGIGHPYVLQHERSGNPIINGIIDRFRPFKEKDGQFVLIYDATQEGIKEAKRTAEILRVMDTTVLAIEARGSELKLVDKLAAHTSAQQIVYDGIGSRHVSTRVEAKIETTIDQIYSTMEPLHPLKKKKNQPKRVNRGSARLPSCSLSQIRSRQDPEFSSHPLQLPTHLLFTKSDPATIAHEAK